jgi:pullulanase/glycogen debranching enzyme
VDIWPGQPYPLGATYDGVGTNFTLFSEAAERVYGYPLGGDDRDRDDADSAPFVPRSVVTNPWFEWGDDRLPRIPWHESVLYECHVKGFTMRHPEIPPDLRGTYAGMAHPAAIEHLRRLGVTAWSTTTPRRGTTSACPRSSTSSRSIRW